ncbi:MAG: hypothetical protein AAF810_27180 [Cyanobacteria bacterium P01_D01_bin.36]
MSNHSGSYMLNEVLTILEDEAVFEFWGKAKTQEISKKIVQIGYDYGCSSGEILENIGARIGLCYCCVKSASSLKNGLCRTCFGEGFSSDGTTDT